MLLKQNKIIQKQTKNNTNYIHLKFLFLNIFKYQQIEAFYYNNYIFSQHEML